MQNGTTFQEKRSDSCWYADKSVDVSEQGKSNELLNARLRERARWLLPAGSLSPSIWKSGIASGPLGLPSSTVTASRFRPATPKRRNWSLLPSCTRLCSLLRPSRHPVANQAHTVGARMIETPFSVANRFILIN